MAKGSNDLNMLLKAQVVKIRAELDIPKSLPKIKEQIKDISKRLEKNPVKLQVKLDYKLTELKTQLKSLETAVHNSKSVRPIKLQVEIDVKGSAKQIKDQLRDVYKTVEDFNRKYGQQVKKMQQQTSQAQTSMKGGANVPTNTNVGGFDLKLYAQQINEAKRLMKDAFGKGNFTSFEMKDAKGNLMGFVAQLEKANGVVQKIQYQWNAQAGKFTPISQQTIDSTEKQVHRATQALRSLQAEMMKLRDGSAKNKLLQDYDSLERRIGQGTLTQDAVKGLRQRIADEQVLQGVIERENKSLHEQKKLIQDIKRARDKSWSTKGDVDLRQQYNDSMRSVRKDGSVENLRAQRLELERINTISNNRAKIDAEALSNTKKRMQLLRQLRQIESKTVSNDKTSQTLIGEIKLMAQRAKSAQDWLAVQSRMNKLQTSNANDAQLQRSMDIQFKLEQKLRRLVDMGKLTSSQFEKAMSQIPITARRNFADLERQYAHVNRMVERETAKMKRNADRTVTLLQGGSNGKLGRISGAVDSGNIQALQRYMGELYKGKVETIRVEQATDSLGRAVDRMKIKMAGTGKTVRTYTVDLDRANKQLRQTAQGVDYNANRNLGIFEQLKIAMARVPVWMVAMSAFYGTLRGLREATREIVEIDKLMTDINRVANDNVNLDHMFEGAVGLSKELGNNLHDILASLGEYARTFGDFNERQLLAITRTATIMSNVSELTADEATRTLVGTMNAFNKTAEESIGIVDALNEVDNNYAISTKQLAEGLSKSASTARTFGVTMEENIGHITAIGSVTMESGKQIGNGLKTIYSRITTLDKAEEVLNGVNVQIKQIGANGEEIVRPVNDILTDLASRWHDLSDAQRQNIAVEVAGRYQLTRFLALMNNYDTALESTKTAIHSHGSAIRENEKYMQSFEARINQMKNSFTEFALALGDAFLSSALLGAIEGLGKLANLAVTVSEKVGVLPIVFLALAGVLGKFKVLSAMHSSIATVFRNVEVGSRRATASIGGLSGGFARATVGARLFGRQVVASMATATTAIRGFGVTWKAVMASTVIGLGFVALGVIIEKIASAFQDAKHKAEELEKMNKQIINSYRELGREAGVENLIAKYELLTNTSKRTTEQQEELERVTADLANQFPSMVEYIDAQGNAHLKTIEAMREQVGVARELSEAQAGIVNAKFNNTILDQANAYAKASKELDKIAKKRAKLEKEDGKTQVTGYTHGSYGSTVTIDNTQNLAENEMDRILKQAELREIIMDTTSKIKEASLAWLEQEGLLANLGDEQQKVVENFIDLNHETLRSAGNSKEAQLQLWNLGNEIGKVFSEAKANVKASIDEMDLSPKERVAELDLINKKFDEIAKSIPKDMFELDANGNIDITVDKMQKLVNVAKDIDDNTQFETLKQSLINIGMTAPQATQFIGNLAKEQKNSYLASQAQLEGYDDVTESLEEMTEALSEALDLTKEMLGYSNQDFSIIESYLQYMDLMVAKYGDAGKATKEYQQAEEDLANFLGVTREELQKNQHTYEQIVHDLQKVDFSTYDDDLSWDKWVNGLEGVSDKTKEVLKTTEMGQNIITGYKKEVEETTVATENQTQANEELSVSSEELKQKTEELEVVFKETKENMNDNTRAVWMETIRTQLNELGGDILVAKDEAGKLKFAMADGTPSPYLDALMLQLSDLGMDIQLIKDEEGNLRLAFNQNGEAIFLDTIDEKLESNKIKISDNITEFDKLNEKEVKPEIDVDFDSLTGGLKDVYINLDELQGAFDKLGENIKKLGDIESIISNLAGMADKLKDSISGLLSNSKGDFKELEDNAKNAKDAVNELSKALDKIKRLASNVDAGGIVELKTICDNTRETVKKLENKMDDLSVAIGRAQESVSGKASIIKGSMNDMSKSAENLGDEIDGLDKEFKSSFDSMRKKVATSTETMVGQHNSQKRAIDNLANSAKLAKTAISNLNDSAKNAMSTLNNYVSKAGQTRNAPIGSGLFGANSVASYSTPNDSVASVMSTFSASAEGAVGGGVESGGGMGSSGIMQPSTHSIFGGLNLDGEYQFSALATRDSRDREQTETMAELYQVNMLDRRKTSFEGTLRMLETRMASLEKGTKKYRDALKDTLVYENQLLAIARKDLANTEAQNKAIEKKLKSLSNTAKHTIKQREEYNKLQQDYDNNLSKIASLKAEVESTLNTFRDKTLEIFNDSIDQIVDKYGKAFEAIGNSVSTINFKIEVLELTEPDNIKAQLDLQIEKVKELTKERELGAKKIAELEKKYYDEAKMYGEKSARALRLSDEIKEAKKEYEGFVIAVLQGEKAIRDIRAKLADDAINELKSYYNNMKSMATSAIDAEIKHLQDAHSKKIKMYDEEISKINEIYDSKLKSLDREDQQKSYEEELAEKQNEKNELLSRIANLSMDDTPEGKKRRAELNKQLVDKEKEISDFMYKNSRELLKQQLQDQKDSQLKGFEQKKESEQNALDETISRLEREKEAVEKHYDVIINNEKYWADMRDEFIKGNFKTLQTELTNMGETLKEMDRGVFSALTKSFTTFSEQVKKQIMEINALAVKNSIFGSQGIISNVNNVGSTGGNTGNASTKNPTPAPTTPNPLGELTTLKPINLWKRNGDKLEFERILPANATYKVYGYDEKHGGQYNVGGGYFVTNMDGYVKYKKFDTGGYTGNSEGLAWLDEKEIVLKDSDTSNLLDAVKLLGNLKNVLPLKRNNIADKLATAGGISVSNNYDLTVNIESLNGDRDGAKLVVSEIMNGLKKMGRRG